jgi:ribosome-associated toxin RatA of RatAB toxin-antitoxin module
VRPLALVSLIGLLAVAAGAKDLGGLTKTKPDIVRAEYTEEDDVGNIKGLKATFYVAAPPDRTLEVLWDVRKFPELFQDIDEMKVRSFEDKRIVVDFKVDAVFKDVRYTLDRRLDRKKRLVRWRDVGGDMDAIRGSWQVAPTSDPNVSRVTYTSFVSVGRFVPDALVRDVAIGKVEAMADRIRGAVRRAAAGEPEPQR